MKAAIQAVVRQQVQLWLTGETETPTAAAINSGYCADFRDGLFSAMREMPALAELDWRDLCYNDFDLDAERPAPPPGLDWGLLSKRPQNGAGMPVGLLDFCCHEWVQFDGWHFDAEVPEGVSNPFDVPCIRRGLTAAIARQQPELLGKLTHDPWWQTSVVLTIQQLKWQIDFDADPNDLTTRQILQTLEEIDTL